MTDMPLQYTSGTGQRPDTTIVRLSGPLTLSTMFGFQAALRDMKPAVLILDLSEVPYMDSAGLGLLMNAHVSAEHNHRKFLLADVNSRLMAIIETTGVNKVLRIFRTVDEAQAAA